MSRRYDFIRKTVWNEQHPAWPRKADGSLYQRPPPKVIDGLIAGKAIKLVPSVTTVLQYSKASALIEWAFKIGCEKAWEFCATHPNASMNDATEFARAARGEAAERGGDIHDALEKALRDGVEPADAVLQRAVASAREALACIGVDPAQAVYEREIVTEDYGGRVDCHTDDWVIDFKTSEKREVFYLNECSQLLAYSDAIAIERSHAGLIETPRNLANILINSKTGELVTVKAWSPDEQTLGRLLWDSCLTIERVTTTYAKENK